MNRAEFRLNKQIRELHDLPIDVYVSERAGRSLRALEDHAAVLHFALPRTDLPRLVESLAYTVHSLPVEATYVGQVSGKAFRLVYDDAKTCVYVLMQTESL